MTPRVQNIKCTAVRRPAPVLNSQLVSLTAPGAFSVSELNLLTLVVHKPGNQPLLRHTEDKMLHKIIFPFFHFYFGKRQGAADCESLFNLAWMII